MIKRACALFLALLTLAACAPSNDSTNETRLITDVWGREVQVPTVVDSIVTLGPGATRLAVYLGVSDQIVGAEAQTADFNILMDFSPIVHDAFQSLPIVGQGGGSGENNAYVESLIHLAPDVILAAFTPEAADDLQAQTGIPVVAVRYISTGLANETFFTAMRVFATTVQAEDRAEEVLAKIESLRNDLSQRTINIPDDARPSVYAGAITFSGQRGFGGTYSNFGPLAAIHANNMADTALEPGFYEVDFEQIITWDPDVIFLDPGNMHLVNAEFSRNPAFFQSLRAVQQGRVYAMPAFNFSATNVTYALMNAYFAGTILFPEQFADINIAEKSAEILTFFLGQNTFDLMAEHGLVFRALTIGSPA